MEMDDLLNKIQEQLLDDDDEISALLLLQQMSQATASLLDSPPKHGGSRPGKRGNVERDRVEGNLRMFRDYFADQPTYNDVLFRRRYRMTRSLFSTIMAAVCSHDHYFTQRPDATGLLGLSSIQKVTAVVRMLGYGVAADATDEYYRLGESTTMMSLNRFVKAIRAVFEPHHLRQPNKDDIEKQVRINSTRGFPGMFASLDCMHYDWKNYPVAWQGQFGDKDGNRSIILEVVVDQSLHFWHAFFGLPGSNNDLNVLERSPLVRNMLRSPAENMHFHVNGTRYPRYYLLTDGIYPKWAVFMQSIHNPQGEKRKHYALMQESVRKDVERAFGVLQARFAIISNPCRLWNASDISDILMACVTLHNMILDDEGNQQLEPLLNPVPGAEVRRWLTPLDYLDGTEEIEDVSAHYSLRNDLIDHLWQVRGEREFTTE